MKSPLTEKSECKLIGTLDPIWIRRQWEKAYGIDVGSFADIGMIERWYCEASGFTWYAPSCAAGSAELYQQLENFPWYYLPQKWEFSEALRYIAKSSRVLEVGVGNGGFLEAARNAGIEAFGVELNPSSAARVRLKGFDVFEDKLSSLHKHNIEMMDSVCAFQVLEHVADPKEFLDGMLSVLKPGGNLILSVPNAKVLLAFEAGINLLDLPPHHMGHWDEDVLRYLERVFPIRLTQVRFEPLADYHIGWFLNGLKERVRRNVGKLPSRLLVNRFSYPTLHCCLALGARRFFRGHSILVVYKYVPG